MLEILEFLINKLEEHWIKVATAAVFMAAGWLIGKFRAQKNWEKREFYDRLNVSLNIMYEDKLLIRTLLEKRCRDIFLNGTAAERVIEAARKTTLENPILPLPKEDYWYYLNSVLNEISEKFAEGQMKRDLGIKVTCEQYLICLTSEADGSVRMRKIRAMVIKRSALTNLPEKCPGLSNAHHSTRWKTLQILAKQYEKQPEQFLLLEICQ